ncbi:sigma-70 family RNA polymerase sigma factor, partial [bacterium]|nr:sigma-70 family RNA polymerase sigma factor [candidate division CSSED10-310 bacterium]
SACGILCGLSGAGKNQHLAALRIAGRLMRCFLMEHAATGLVVCGGLCSFITLREVPTGLNFFPWMVSIHMDDTNETGVTTDEQLVNWFLEGREEVFQELVQRYRDQIFRYCARIVRNQEDAMDLCQDVFVKVFKKLDSFKMKSSFKTWLYRIATNHAYNHLRYRKLLRPLADFTGGDEKPRALDELLNEEQERLLHDGVEKLPAKQKQVVILRIYEEMSFREIAEVIGRAEGTVKANYFHAIQNLRAIVGG